MEVVIRAKCADCKEVRRFDSFGANHVLHLLLSITLGSIWWFVCAAIFNEGSTLRAIVTLAPLLIWPIVWFVLARRRKYFCSHCGSSDFIKNPQ